MKKTIIALALALSLPAFAQVGADSQSRAGATASLGSVNSSTTVNLPGSSPTQGVMYGGGYDISGTQTVKSTGQAIAPNLMVSSGGFNCAGTTSAALGLPGFAASGGTTAELAGCLTLNAALLYGQRGDAPMFEAIMCELAPVKAAQKKRGFDCDTLAPIAKPVAAAPSAGPVTAATTSDPYIAARIGR